MNSTTLFVIAGAFWIAIIIVMLRTIVIAPHEARQRMKTLVSVALLGVASAVFVGLAGHQLKQERRSEATVIAHLLVSAEMRAYERSGRFTSSLVDLQALDRDGEIARRTGEAGDPTVTVDLGEIVEGGVVYVTYRTGGRVRYVKRGFSAPTS